MKTKISLWKKLPVVLMSVLCSAVIIAGCDKDNDDDDNMNRTYSISGNASGDQMVPAVTGAGTGTINGTYNASTRQLNYTSNWNGLTGAPVAGSFYYGASGVSGTTVSTPWIIANDATATGSTTGTITLTPEEAAQLLAGNWYYAYSTTANPTGEIRGQITAVVTE
jgi:hypothetical protein